MLQGIAHKYAADVNTDVIIPARYLNLSLPEELAPHCMEDIDSGFVERVRPGDIIVAGANFGCGSSREHAPLAIKASGISAVIAESFARIFFRNSINTGLPLLESEAAARGIDAGDEVTVDIESGLIHNNTKYEQYQAKPYPEFMAGIIAAGGLIEYTRLNMKKRGAL